MTMLGCARLGLAQDQYRGLPYPPNEIFEAMLGYAEEDGFPGLTASLRYIQPLTAALHREFKLDPEAGIRAALAEKNAEKARLAVLGLIFLDLRLNLRTAGEAEEAAKRAESVQMAFLDFELLSPAIKAKNRVLDRTAHEDFRRMYAAKDRMSVQTLAEKLLGRLAPAIEGRN